ncbi:MAG: hypothetical protein U1E10_05800, partial [Bdellovibrionales bacterium]|nr:hypothetical protein [Bdellovibrionales bacterium]
MFSYETRLSKCRFLGIIFFLHVLLNIVPAHADSSSAFCANQWQQIKNLLRPTTLPPTAGFDKIAETNLKLKAVTPDPTEVLSLKQRVSRFRANTQRLVEP